MSNTDTRQAILGELNGVHPFGLANRAATYSPDTETSPGAQYLARVRDAAVELLDTLEDWTTDPDDLRDEISELADTAVPIYTADRWRTLADLGAWDTDTSDFGPFLDMTDAAGVALYVIAETLAYELVREALTSWQENTDTDE